MHCHSTASQVSKLGVQRALGLPECATPPEEVYELAKRRGMDFVTITDHDTIDGVFEIADRPDVFVSEELTAHFRGEPQAVHVLCYGITARGSRVAAGPIPATSSCAPPTCTSGRSHAPWPTPTTTSRRRSPRATAAAWRSCSASGRSRNGARARELNLPAATYVATRDSIGIGGTDDHAGVDIGRTFTAAPRRGDARRVPRAPARRPRLRARQAGQRGEVGARGDRSGGALARAGAARAGPRPRVRTRARC